MDRAIEATLKALEIARREKNYRLMERLADVLRLAIIDSTAVDPALIRSRISYEDHMAFYQRAQVAPNPSEKQRLLADSRLLAEQSAQEALAAGDIVGRLFTEMNISGLILPDLEQWGEALEMSERTSKEAVEIAARSETSENDRLRAQRVAMNCYFHRLRILVAHDGDPTSVQQLLDQIAANPVYLAEYTQADWALRDIAAATAFIENKVG